MTEPRASRFGPRLQVANDEYDAVREGRVRIRIGAALFCAALGLAALRLGEVALLTPNLAPRAAAPSLPPARADITDRHGELLATTLTTYALIAEKPRLWDVDETVDALIRLRPDLFEAASLRAKLSAPGFEVPLARGLSPREREAVFALGLPGLAFRTEARRAYPAGALAAHVVGYADVDMVGLAGAEKAFEAELSGGTAPVALSIDARVQHALEDELLAGLELFKAQTVAGVVLDVRTGEILAMASLPGFDANRAGSASPQSRYAHATMSTYELGSVFKPLTLATALETGTATPDQVYPVHEAFTVQRKRIRDDHPSDVPLRMADVLAESSNRGTALMALDFGAANQQLFLQRLGLNARVNYGLGESAAPQLQSDWQDITTVTVSYGHGLSVTPLAFAAAAASLFNDGLYVAPTILRRDDTPPARRVFSHETARTLQGMMRYVATDGTGRKADVPGYGVMGKTGTADKPGVGGYDTRRLVTSFIAGFPYPEPRYAVLVTFDEPKAVEGTWGYATAGWNAAPTTGRVIARIAPMLGVEKRPAEATLSPWTPPEEDGS